MARRKSMAEQMGIRLPEIIVLNLNRIEVEKAEYRLLPHWRNSILRVINPKTGQIARDYGPPPNAHLRLM